LSVELKDKLLTDSFGLYFILEKEKNFSETIFKFREIFRNNQLRIEFASFASKS
jgi:hypothetical protein